MTYQIFLGRSDMLTFHKTMIIIAFLVKFLALIPIVKDGFIQNTDVLGVLLLDPFGIVHALKIQQYLFF